MAGIIKASGQIDAAVKAPLKAFQFDDVGQSYLGRVRSEAMEIVNQARAQAAQIKVKATEEGRQAAIQAAQASLKARLDQQLGDILTALRQAVVQIEQSRQAWQQHWECHTVNLAAAMAVRICRRELSRQPDISLTWIREALAMAGNNAEVTVRLHPDDCANLSEHIEKLRHELTGIGPVKIVADATISAGGCRVDTEFGSLDQQLESQLNRITEELLS
jgi:flagellar assembly protein FliH